jgi:hypothetical protein
MTDLIAVLRPTTYRAGGPPVRLAAPTRRETVPAGQAPHRPSGHPTRRDTGRRSIPPADGITLPQVSGEWLRPLGALVG